jgi:hypothetical protein
MKTITRMALGIISCLLLSAGLARAAQQVDPLSQSIGPDSHENVNMSPADGCSSPCQFEVE